MSNIYIIVVFLMLSYFSYVSKALLIPLLTRANKEIDLGNLLVRPFKLSIQAFRRAVIDRKNDAFSLVKIIALHFSLLGISQINNSNVSSICQILVLFYVVYAIFDLFQQEYASSGKREPRIKNLAVAIVLMTSVTALISVLLANPKATHSFLSEIIVGLYCLLMLISGLGVRSSIITESQNSNFYQALETRFARFTWTSFFIASFDPASVDHFFPFSWFVLKLILIEVFFTFLGVFVPRLNTSYRWKTIFRLVIPVALLCVYGVYVGVRYV